MTAVLKEKQQTDHQQAVIQTPIYIMSPDSSDTLIYKSLQQHHFFGFKNIFVFAEVPSH